MNEKDELLKVGRYNLKFNEILGTEIDELEIYRSKGLPALIKGQSHFSGFALCFYSIP